MSLKKALIAHKRLVSLAILLLTLVVGVVVVDIIDEDFDFLISDEPKPAPESENDKPIHENDCKKEEVSPEVSPEEKTKADMLAKIKLLGIVYNEEVKGAIEEKINELDLTSKKNYAVFKVEKQVIWVTTSEKVNCGWRLSQITSDYVIIESEKGEEIKIRLAK